MGPVSAARSPGGAGARVAAHRVRSGSGERDGAPAGVADEFTGLVERMLAGEAEAFRLVYRSIQPGLLRYVSALVGAGEAEDVTSEAWAQAVRDLGRFSGDGDGFRAWISTIARHRALDQLRARGRRPVLDVPVDDLAHRAAADDPEQGALEAMSTAEALAMIRSLPAEQAEAVLLRSVIGLDAKAAGKLLGKRAGAVRTAAYRGLRALAQQLDQQLDQRPDRRPAQHPDEHRDEHRGRAAAGDRARPGDTFRGGGADESR
jgi:RNA polymerase sigma-70 factor (ECF subfamily)